MNRFHVIEDAAVILICKGVYRQVKLYRRGRELFAAHGSGFIGLRRGHGTTAPAISWAEFEGVEWEEKGLGKIHMTGKL